jgi:hypothetical protein
LTTAHVAMCSILRQCQRSQRAKPNQIGASWQLSMAESAQPNFWVSKRSDLCLQASAFLAITGTMELYRIIQTLLKFVYAAS